MSKLDQLKALGDAKRAARMYPVAKEPKASVTDLRCGAGSEGSSRHVAGRTATTTSEKLDVTAEETAPNSKRGRGRPKVEGPRPWEAQGISKTSYYRYRRQAEKK